MRPGAKVRQKKEGKSKCIQEARSVQLCERLPMSVELHIILCFLLILSYSGESMHCYLSNFFHLRSGSNHMESNVDMSISTSSVDRFKTFPKRGLSKGLWPELTQVTGTTLTHRVSLCPLFRILLGIYFQVREGKELLSGSVTNSEHYLP